MIFTVTRWCFQKLDRRLSQQCSVSTSAVSTSEIFEVVKMYLTDLRDYVEVLKHVKYSSIKLKGEDDDQC